MKDLQEKYYDGRTSPEEEKRLFNNTEDKLIEAEGNYFYGFRHIDLPADWSFKPPSIAKTRWLSPMRIAAGILVGAAIYSAGYYSYVAINDTQEQRTKIEMELIQARINAIEETLSQNNVHSARKGLSMVSQLNYMDEHLANELLGILNASESINLRLLALEQLTRHVNLPFIKEKIFNSVDSQSSELVLAELARIAIIMKDRAAAAKILEQMNSQVDANSNTSIPMKRELEILL